VRHVRMLGAFLLAALMMAAVIATSASAERIKKSPSTFKNCPVHATETDEGEPIGTEPNAFGILCVYGNTEKGDGGQFTVSGITVPLEKSIVLQYGLYENEAEEEKYLSPLNGVEAITPTPERVPGEPIANISEVEQEEMGWPATLKNKYKEGQKKGLVKKVYETIEVAGRPQTSRKNLVERNGTAVEAPVKIKGENKWLSMLGDVCYIGSEAEPIVQHLTSGVSESPLTHETIEGELLLGEFLQEKKSEELGGLVIVSKLVDNTYPVPGASCTGPFSGYVAATIDKVFGVPAVAGASITELKGSLYNATAKFAES